MTNNDDFARLLPRVEINWEAIENAWNALENINRCENCKADGLVLFMHISARLVDSSVLAIENRRLIERVANAREESANLLAAIRSALSAADDGEEDPLWYLRDEYTAHETPSSNEERRWCV